MADIEKISLRNIDIVVSYREANEERRENLYAVLAHLAHTYADYRLWLMEGAAEPSFDWMRLKDPKIRHVFIAHAGPFPKSMLYNAGVRLCLSPVICFHDADSVARPAVLRECVDALLDRQDCEVLCPYWSVINVAGALKQSFVEEPDYERLASIHDASLPADANQMYATANGGIVLFKKQEYIRVGGYNARIEGWGGEDDELLRRAGRLGLRWHSVHTPLVHLHHDSNSRAAHIEGIRDTENLRASLAIADMSLEEVEELARELRSNFC